MQKTEVRSGRVGGLVYYGKNKSGPMLVLFNQWRSGASSILSKYIAELVLKHHTYSCILFIDRIASGGASDNMLSLEERRNMRFDGEFQFGKAYADAIIEISKQHSLPKKFVIGGSSAGAPASIATVKAMNTQQRQRVQGLILVEPSGLRVHGFGKSHRGSIAHALSRHVVAYRHRIQRGWWTPMDKEQYFAKGALFEYRARWFAGDYVFKELCKVLSDSSFPPVRLVLSRTSHVHTNTVRENLKKCTTMPHKIIEVTGNHDKICQPPSLSEFYLGVASAR